MSQNGSIQKSVCGCEERLYFSDAGFGEPGGWYSQSGEPDMIRRCSRHRDEYFEKKLEKAQIEATREAFKKCHGFYPWHISCRLEALVKEREEVVAEIEELEDLRRRFSH